MGFFKKAKDKLTGGVNNAKNQAQQLADKIKREKEIADAKILKAKRDADDKVKKALRDAEDKAKATAQKVKDALAKVKLLPKDAPYVNLLPFKPVMKDMLNKRGVKHDGSISDIAKKFIQFVITPSYSKTKVTNVLNAGKPMVQTVYGKTIGNTGNTLIAKHSFNLTDEATGNEWEEKSYTEEGSTASQYEEGAKATKGIIQKIIAWFKERKAKKEAKKLAEEQAQATGQPVPDNYGDTSYPPITPEEVVAVDTVEAIAKDINDTAEKDVKDEEDFDAVEILFVVIAIVVVVALAKKMLSPSK